jgi:hypothetical protein
LHARKPGRSAAGTARKVADVLMLTLLVFPCASAAATGGTSLPPPPPPAPVPGEYASLSSDERTAIPPAAAPEAVKRAIRAANRITRKPYLYGGGHRRFRDRGYDCSGSVSYALHGGGLLERPLSSRALLRWGQRGPGEWITVYANRGHAYVLIAGLRFDTSGPGASGPRWRRTSRSSRGYRARHPAGF